MNTKSVMLGASIAALSLAALAVAPANAETADAGHAAAIEVFGGQPVPKSVQVWGAGAGALALAPIAMPVPASSFSIRT